MPPPKKREKDANSTTTVASNGNNNNNSSSSNNGTNLNTAETTKMNGHHQQEQELFLQAFEKPTQIYRFLRNRHGTSPIFLNRTLSYMKDRMSRNNKKRANFKVSSILDTITHKTETVANNYLNIIYNGLFDKGNSSGGDQWWNAGDVVCVESTLYKITKSKRKDSTSDFQEVFSYSSNIVYNPHDDIDQFSSISIPVQSMQLGDQHTIYKLLFRIKLTPKFAYDDKKDENAENEETPNKRSKSSTKIYGCELIVFEKNIGCIPEGDYEAALQELSSTSIKSFSPKKRTWETLPDNYIPLTMKFDVFQKCPTLKFRLTWTANEMPLTIGAKDLCQYGTFADASAGNGESLNGNITMNGESQINHNNNCIKSNTTTTTMTMTNGMQQQQHAGKAEKIQIVYNFLYSNNTRQQTEYTQEVICPWCGLDCLRLYALLKHLKLCHARFNFTYQPAGNGARIDVTINDSYDGSYAGSPYDLAGPSGCSFARTCGPVRRTSVTNLLVCRPRRQKTCLDEFLVLDEDDLSNQRPYITGHNRLYHHTETCLPVHPKELDIDSEGESDPLWLRQKTIQMIDEFSDVNEGEKELMKLWNLHVMKHGYVGDCQLPLACEMFLDAKGHEIIRKNLYRNFILHMCSLFDYGLVSPETVYKTVQKLQGMLSKYAEGQDLMSKQREAQLKYWLEVGIHKQDEQKLKSPQKQSTSSNGNSSDAACSSANASVALDSKTMMHPPAKRSATAVKRASMHPQNVASNDKALTAAGGSKGVAKKSASQNDELQGSAAVSTRERRTTAGGSSALTSAEKDKLNEQKFSEKTRYGSAAAAAAAAADTKSHAVKRRLSVKDAASQPASKRNRFDSTNNNANISSATTTSASATISITRSAHKHDAAGKTITGSFSSTSVTTTIRSSNATTTTLPPKRLITRRQSIAGTITTATEIAATATSHKGDTHKVAATTNLKTTTTTTTHSLRTRLSVPLTKIDKR